MKDGKGMHSLEAAGGGSLPPAVVRGEAADAGGNGTGSYRPRERRADGAAVVQSMFPLEVRRQLRSTRHE
jgi:hypothetical protein